MHIITIVLCFLIKKIWDLGEEYKGVQTIKHRNNLPHPKIGSDSSDARWHFDTSSPLQQRPNDKKFKHEDFLSFCQRESGIPAFMSLGGRSTLRSGS